MVPITELTDKVFMTSVIENQETTIVQFVHLNDTSCLSMMVKLDELASDYAATSFKRVNINKNCDTASRCGLLAFPSILVFEGGREVKKIVGVKDRIALFMALQPWLV